MRRLGMKNKRWTSETSGSETEENGAGDYESRTTGRNNNDASSGEEAPATPATRKSAVKRRSRGATAQQRPARAGNYAESEEPNERENGERATVSTKASPNKRKKKEEHKASTSSGRDKPDEYEVEKLVGHRTIKGRRQFLVRWKDYNESADSWENEKDLNCSELIEEYLINEQESKETKLTKAKPAKADKSKKSRDEQNVKENSKETLNEFEVERIIDVRFKKNGIREFLIRWKGFSAVDDTWEPEKNLNCSELIAKFMQKLEKVKAVDMRELRANRVRTKRYTLSTHDSGRRLSRRHLDKQRATYHECDE